MSIDKLYFQQKRREMNKFQNVWNNRKWFITAWANKSPKV